MSYGFGVSGKTRDCFSYISKINVRVGDRLRVNVSATLLLRLVFVLRLGLELSLGLWFRVLGEPLLGVWL